jgi:DNA-binding NarL/FixJ family response regulator
MATLFSVSIMGEGRILTEALSIALRTRGLLATVMADSCETPPILSPEVLILAGYGSYARVREQLATARATFPHAKIIVLGRSGDKGLPRYVLENVAQCLFIADSFEKLLRTLEVLRDPSSPRPRTVEPDAIGRLTGQSSGLDPRSSELTIREQDVFKSISAGLSNKEIADLFSISTSTVKNHVHNILTKLNIRRRRYALGQTYIPRIQSRHATSTSEQPHVGDCEVAS